MLWLYIALGVVGFVILCAIALAAACYFEVFFQRNNKPQNHYRLPNSPHFERNREEMYALISEMDAVPFERVQTKSFDGLTLSARYYHQADGAPLQIEVHGYRGTGVRDFCGGNKLARKMGFNILLVDMRAHGCSQGHTITFGAKEQKDVLSWVNYAVERFGENTEIWLAGVSMGATSVLLASNSVPQNVKGIIADSPYRTPAEVIAETCKNKKLPPRLAMPFIRLGALLFGRFRLGSADAAKAVGQAKAPILMIHGEADDIVPCRMSQPIFAMCKSDAERHTFPDAGHGLSYMCDGKRYEQLLAAFVERGA